MKKALFGVIASIILLASCSNIGEPEEIVQESDDSEKETAIIPKYSISEDNHKMLVPFETSEARGLVASNLNTRLDIDEFETGLMRMALDTFPTDEYYFKEGQYLDGETVGSWLARKKEGKDLEEALKKDKNFKNEGLNPPKSKKGSETERNENSPIYLAHILEHDYLVKKDEKSLELGGLSIGLALNSVHYYKTEQGYPREKEIPKDTLERVGKEYAQEIVNRIRGMEGLSQVPIVVSIYAQAPKSSIVPGQFIAKTVVDKGSSKIGKWTNIDEKYYFFPSSEASEKKPDDANRFNLLKGDIEEFFPNYTGVIGIAFYQNDELRQMKIDIPMQFYGKTEVIAFTQYLAGKVMEYYREDYISLEVNITSTNGEEAVIIKKPGQEEPFVHVYQ
ncbi:CamS family sex pheromone protein [Bacillus sp. FJAT-47783]|uniref:CamS family sex pheromone protein n=1 Tax=Bacillus sp. FJAT-47783 TaxID=2922712 RepID=UPI001FADF1DF|nr:CamS family sex pheromone protein [Bacillus sp. FJAT-47783]